MSETFIDSVEEQIEIRQAGWGWALTIGCLSIAAGFFAILFPLIASVAYSLFFGAILAVGGCLQLWDAFRRRRTGEFWFELGLGVLALVTGAIFLFAPGAGVFSLTLVFAVYFIIDATMRFFLASRRKTKDRRGWMIAGGVLSLFLGLIILFGLPRTALYTVGILWGGHAIFIGVHFTAAALAARKRIKP